MANFDTSWFDLKKYEPVKNFTLKDWHYNLQVRRFCFDVLKCGFDVLVETLKQNPILEEDHFPGYYSCNEKYLFNTASVKSTPKFHILSRMDELEYLKSNISDVDISDTFNNLIPSDFFETLVSINLNATDEQLKADFAHWLENYRENTGYESVKKTLFSDSDLKKWTKLKLLECIDLILISKLEGSTLTQVKLGRLLYPDELGETADRTERVKNTTKPKAEWLISESTIRAIETQLTGRHKISKNNTGIKKTKNNTRMK